MNTDASWINFVDDEVRISVLWSCAFKKINVKKLFSEQLLNVLFKKIN